MEPNWTIDWVWWIGAVELPALAGLFWLIQRVRRDGEAEIDGIRRRVADAAERLRDGLAAYKLEVAQTYASITYLKDVESRLTEHLVRIEAKLDRAAGWPATAPAGRPGGRKP